MKKIIYLLFFCLLAISMSAQRIAVFEFTAGTGLSLSDISNVSAIFETYFNPSGYTMVERVRIDKVLAEQHIQSSNITEKQAVQVGKILNATFVVIGVITDTHFNGTHEYNIDVRAVSVEEGKKVATAGESVRYGDSYRNVMKSIAQNLAQKIEVCKEPTHSQRYVTSSTTTTYALTPQTSNSPIVLYDYLKVFPNDLGSFDSEPITIIAQINNTKKYGYDSWRLPTKEELNLMIANGLVNGNGYMVSDGSPSGKVRLVTEKKSANKLAAEKAEQDAIAKGKAEQDAIAREKAEQDAIAREKAENYRIRQEEIYKGLRHGYVDLGLPSGTLWKSRNELNYYKFEEALVKFGNQLPTKEQYEELESICTWKWIGNGYKVIGPNDAYIILPAAGMMDKYWYDVEQEGYYGGYWTSSKIDHEAAWRFEFNNTGVLVKDSWNYFGYSIRLVK